MRPRAQNIPGLIVGFANSVLADVEFEWGVTDCVWLARQGWELVTGEDILGDIIPEYHNKDEAIETYKSIGLFQDVLDSIGAQKLSPHRLVHGDLIFHEEPEDGYQNIGLVCGKNVLVVDEAESKFTTYPLKAFIELGGYVGYRAPKNG